VDLAMINAYAEDDVTLMTSNITPTLKTGKRQ
jgi:hypothetical protein